MSRNTDEVTEKENEFYIYYSNIIKYYSRIIFKKLNINSKLYLSFRPYDLKRRLELSDSVDIKKVRNKDISIDDFVDFILSPYLLKKGLQKSHITRLISEIELDSNTIHEISENTESSKKRQKEPHNKGSQQTKEEKDESK